MRPVLDFLELTEVELGPRLENSRALLHDPSALMPVALAGDLFAEAARRSGREDLGLRTGSAVSVLEYADWGPVVARSETVGDFVSALATTSRRFNSGNRMWAVQRGADVWLNQRFTPRITRGRRIASEFSLSLILQGLRLALGPDWRPSEIRLEGPAPRHAAELAALASQRIRFEQPHLSLIFSAHLLARRYPPLSAVAPAAERALVPADSFAGSIRQVVESLVRLGTAELGVAAEVTRMSERSLQRRLNACGLSFTHLVDEVRFDSARRLLRDPTVKIVAVSAELGYSDSANFTRAFRRWAGVSPQAFRAGA